MELIGIQSKDIYATFEFSVEELKLFKVALDNATLELNLLNLKHEEANKFIKDIFYPIVVHTLKQVEQYES